MTWPGEKQRHAMSSRGVRTAEDNYKMGARGDRKPDVALTAVMTGDDDKPYGVGVAEQNVQGYSPFYKGDLWFKTYQEAVTYADDYNKKMGLTPKEAYMIVASSMRASGIPQVMFSPSTDEKGKQTGGTLTIPMTDENAAEISKLEYELMDMGITFDTGYDTESKGRDWELDWSFKGGKVVPIVGGVELHIPIPQDFPKLKNIEERLQKLGVNLKPVWDYANDTEIWVIRRAS